MILGSEPNRNTFPSGSCTCISYAQGKFVGNCRIVAPAAAYSAAKASASFMPNPSPRSRTTLVLYAEKNAAAVARDRRKTASFPVNLKAKRRHVIFEKIGAAPPNTFTLELRGSVAEVF